MWLGVVHLGKETLDHGHDGDGGVDGGGDSSSGDGSKDKVSIVHFHAFLAF